MDPVTLEALKESIRKWHGYATLQVPKVLGSFGPKNCPLCQIYWNQIYWKMNICDTTGAFKANCDGCPVKERTGQHGCGDTPYEDAVFTHDDWVSNYSIDIYGTYKKAAQEAMHKEFVFLESLLPEGETWKEEGETNA